MLDNIEELLKKKALADINAQIGQGASVEGQGTQDLQPRPIPAEPVVNTSVEEVQKSEPLRMPAQQARMIADALTGATPALVSFVTGASPTVNNMQFDKMNAYAKARGNQDIPTKANTVTLDDGTGKPVLEMMQNSIGKQPWVKPAADRDAKGNSSKAFDLHKAYSEELGKTFTLVFNKDTKEFFNMDGTPANPPADTVINPVSEKMFRLEDVQGNVTYNAYNQYNSGKKTAPNTKSKVAPVASTSGLGSHYGVGTKGQGAVIEKGYDDAQKEAQTLTGSSHEVNEALKTLKSTKDPRQMAEAIYSLVRSIESKGVLTDQDFKIISGDDYNTWTTNLSHMVETKAFGNIEELRNSYIGLAEKVKRRIDGRIGSVATRFAPNSKPAQEGLKNTVPKAGAGVKARLIKIEQQAAKLYGKGTPKYTKAMQTAKEQLGIVE